MKTITAFIFIFYSCLVYSQNLSGDAGAGLTNFANMSQFQGGTIIFNKPNEIKGNIYAFEEWGNIAVVNIDKQDYRLDNINFNMKTNNFESQVGNDSIFILDEKNIEYLHINNRKFRNYYFARKNKNENFEIIYDGDDMKLMKGYEIGIRYGKPDPTMVRKAVDKYFTTIKYYIKVNNNIKEISLKKKAILSLFKDKNTTVSSYIKKNKLSFKKDRDLNRIFSYHHSL